MEFCHSLDKLFDDEMCLKKFYEATGKGEEILFRFTQEFRYGRLGCLSDAKPTPHCITTLGILVEAAKSSIRALILLVLTYH